MDEEKATVGTLHPQKTMFFRQHVGTIGPKGDVDRYELSVNMSGYSPIVHDKKSGTWFTLSWPEILDLAIQAGINEPPADSGLRTPDAKPEAKP
jgi:hypothetical protein